jgi:hypothetical protein
MGIRSLKKKVLLFLAFGALSAAPTEQEILAPWLTGPLLQGIPAGASTVSLYLFATTNTGFYNEKWHFSKQPMFYSINPELFAVFGLNSWMGFQMTPQLVWNITQNQSSINFGDLPMGLDIQLVDKCRFVYFPGVKLSLLETFPTGIYQDLKPSKLGTDATGLGTFITEIDLTFNKTWLIKPQEHFLNTFITLGYGLNTPVDVRGFNAYGGGYGTEGTVRPGNYFLIIFSFEYSFNKQWAFTMDTEYIYTNKIGFSGDVGVLASGAPAVIAFPSAEQISFTPAIEYNFNDSLGLLAGVWFTAWGRNTTAFISGSFNLNYFY